MSNLQANNNVGEVPRQETIIVADGASPAPAVIRNPQWTVWAAICCLFLALFTIASVIVLSLIPVYLATRDIAQSQSSGWGLTGNMNAANGHSKATVLANGNVLVAGGYNNGQSTSSSSKSRTVRATTDPGFLSSSQLFNPSTKSWSSTGGLSTARQYHFAARLNTGNVLVAGGYNTIGSSDGYLTSAELYNPSTGTWSNTGSMNVAREAATTSVLSDGRVLVAGGYNYASGYLNSAELYDPSTGTWTNTGSLNTKREFHEAVVLNNGKVLVFGGYNFDNYYLSSAELYDPSTGTWTNTGSMNAAREQPVAVLLKTGKVLAVGGYNSNSGYLNSAELYDPSTGTWSLTGSMSVARQYHTATVGPKGNVLVTGGFNSNSKELSSAESYNPSSGTWAAVKTMTAARRHHTASLLATGKILITGGYNSVSGYLDTAEIFGGSQ